MESQIKILNRQVDEANRKANSAQNAGASYANENNPELLHGQIKKLKKENALLKQEIENRFDKDKVLMQGKLADAIREKQVLEESNQTI